MKNYTVYHLHSDLSNGVTNIDSVTKFDEYISYANDLGMKSIGFSEHGCIFEHIKKREICERYKMKYLHGEEFYVTETLNEKLRDNYHVVVIARNYQGYLELNKLSSIAFNRANVKTVGTSERYYYVPRITFEELINTSDNLIITTACLGGILHKGNDNIKKRFIQFLIDNKERCFLEIQHHNKDEQIEYNKRLYSLSIETGIRLIAGTDTHCLNKQHEKGREILQKSKNIFFNDESGWDLTFKTYDELIKCYEEQNALPKEIYLEAIKNTNVMSDMVEMYSIDKSYKYPHLWKTPNKTLIERIKKGLAKRNVKSFPNAQEYIDRIKYELKAFQHNGAIDFMLLMTDVIEFCNENDIEIGYGRGSCNGSIVAWVLGITEMDSIKHNLNFERFMNIERVSLSDIDTDFPPSRRDEVKQFLYNREGLICCDIITFNTIALRGAIRDVARALKIPLDKVSEICDLADNDIEKAKELYPELFEYVDIVEGTIVSIGTHPCGLVTSDLNIVETFGLCTTSTSNYPVSQIYMKEIDGLNYVKLDLLNLDTIELINSTCKLAGIERLTPNNVDITDINVWDSIRDDTTMIFQWESDSAQDYIKKILSDEVINKFKENNPNIDRMTLLSIGNGAIRPAGASYRDDLANGITRLTGCKPIDDYLSDTFGYLVFQCQIIGFLNKLCGFTMGEADIVRRCIDENSLISMADGTLKKIKDIKIGDTVQCFDGNGATQCSNVTNVFDNGIQETFEITSNNNYKLIATGNHKILTQDGWKCVKDLTLFDYIMTPKKINSVSDGLKPNQRLDSNDLFLLGLLLGDGSMNGASYGIHFTNSDEHLIEKYKECVNHRIKHKKKNNCEFRISEIKGKTVDKIYSVYVKSEPYKKSLYNFIKKLNMNVLSANKHIPENIIKYPPNEKTASLLGALFSTDGGNINKSKAIEYSSISKQLVLDIKQLLLKFGIYSYIYSSNVKEYDYKCYMVRISQRDSLNIFKNKILPYVVGKKANNFKELIEKNEAVLSYNYLLPNNHIKEILNNSKEYDISFNSIGIALKNDTVSDVKANKIVQKIYCPNTYKLLMSHYEPMRIKKIESYGERHVYDIEVDNFHNYVANGIIVHNCFSKKLGTGDWLPIIKDGGYSLNGNGHYIKGFIQTMKEEYNYPREKSEKDIISFIKVIEDASSYLFSLNHSQPYSYEGYVSGYLRYYYPVEFITSALNININNAEKTTKIVEYAKTRDIKISSAKFRYSSANYIPDVKNKTIYKGTASIKFLNEEVSNIMYSMRDKQFNSFIDFLQVNPCNSRQLEILIQLRYFEEFGKTGKLIKACELFNKFNKKSQISKSKLTDEELEIISEYAVETKTLYKFTDIDGFINRLYNNIEDKELPLSVLISAQAEYLGYIDIVIPKLKNYAYIMDVDTKYSPKLTCYKIDTGETIIIKMNKKSYNDSNIEKGCIVQCTTIYKPKMKKVDGEWICSSETELWINKYKIISKPKKEKEI